MEKDVEKDTVLFVDDEESILNALKRELYDEEYKCLFALSGSQALKIMQTEKISVIISDMKMPEIDGLRLLKVVKEKYPDTVRIVLSGYTQLPQVLVTINQAEVFKFLTKPWGGELKSVILQAISYHHMLQDRAGIEQLLKAQGSDEISFFAEMKDVVLNAKNASILKTLVRAMPDSPVDGPETGKQFTLALSLFRRLAEMDFNEFRKKTLEDICVDFRAGIE